MFTTLLINRNCYNKKRAKATETFPEYYPYYFILFITKLNWIIWSISQVSQTIPSTAQPVHLDKQAILTNKLLFPENRTAAETAGSLTLLWPEPSNHTWADPCCFQVYWAPGLCWNLLISTLYQLWQHTRQLQELDWSLIYCAIITKQPQDRTALVISTRDWVLTKAI